MNIKYFLNRIRHNHYVSATARRVCRPIHHLCRQAANQIERKVWISGATATYDDILLKFPSDVGSTRYPRISPEVPPGDSYSTYLGLMRSSVKEIVCASA